MADGPEWFARILDLQVEQNPEALADLERGGVDAGSPPRLGFFYVAPGEPEASRA